MTRPAIVVYDMPRSDRFVPPQPRHGPVRLPELMALAMALRSDGHDVGDAFAKVEAISAAVDAELGGYAPSRHLADDLLTMNPEEVAQGLRRCALDMIAQQEMLRVRDDLETRLVATATTAVRAVSDSIIHRMRVPFDTAVKAVQEAADRGIAPNTDATAVLETADAATLSAYRGLAPAVSVLDELYARRTQMTLLGQIGPPDHPLCGFLTGVTEDQLEAAEGIWLGDSEVVSNVVTGGPAGGGTHPARRRRHRLGGPWLALVTSGYQLKLNTATEADAVLAAAQRGGDDD